MKYSPDSAKVIRDGRALKVPASEVVPGDIILVSVGNRIPADARLLSISSGSFRIDQALLTGESESVSKVCEAVGDAKAVKQDMINMLFSVRLYLPLLPILVSHYDYTHTGNNSCEWNGDSDRHRDGNTHRVRRHSYFD